MHWLQVDCDRPTSGAGQLIAGKWKGTEVTGAPIATAPDARDPIHDHNRGLGRGLVHVTGPDAVALLDNVITNDMGRLRGEPPGTTNAVHAGTAIHAGLLTPQGKILFAFFVVPVEEGFLLDLPSGDVSAFMKRLTLYRLRAKVDISDVSDRWSVSLASNASPVTGITVSDPRHASLPHRNYRAEPRAPDADAFSEAAYCDARIAATVAEIGADYESATTFPHEANWDRDGSVDFKKGCFIGQEVVSRAQHKAVARKRFVTVRSDGALETRADVKAGAATIGQIGSVASDGREALALIRLDRAVVALAADTPVTTGTATLTIRQAELDDYRAKSQLNEAKRIEGS